MCSSKGTIKVKINTHLILLSYVAATACLLPFSALYTLKFVSSFLSASFSCWLFLLFSAQCSHLHPYLGFLTNCGGGFPCLFSATSCCGGAYYCFLFPSSSSSFSFSRAYISTPAIGPHSANHQCSHRPTWYLCGGPSPGTGQPNSNGCLVPTVCAHRCRKAKSFIFIFKRVSPHSPCLY